MPLAKRAASSLLPKFSPHTCRASRHWWKLGVAWLYLSPLPIGQFMTTCGNKGGGFTKGGQASRPRAAGRSRKLQAPGQCADAPVVSLLNGLWIPKWRRRKRRRRREPVRVIIAAGTMHRTATVTSSARAAQSSSSNIPKVTAMPTRRRGGKEDVKTVGGGGGA